MYIKNKKKVKKIDGIKALKKDAKAVKKVSLFGAFILSYIIRKSNKKTIEPEATKVYIKMLDGYKIPKNFSLTYRNGEELVKTIGDKTVFNLKRFIKDSYKK